MRNYYTKSVLPNAFRRLYNSEKGASNQLQFINKNTFI